MPQSSLSTSAHGEVGERKKTKKKVISVCLTEVMSGESELFLFTSPCLGREQAGEGQGVGGHSPGRLPVLGLPCRHFSGCIL